MWNKPTCFYFERTSYSTCPPRIVFAAIYEVWSHGYGEHWISEYEYFMANPVRITERGPKTLGEITEIHEEMCAFVKKYEPKDGNYHIHKSYPQVLLVCDELPRFGAAKDDDGNTSLKKVAERQIVLVVKARSAEDISFDDLASHALPLERTDVGDLDVLRVPLSVSVKYMIALDRRTTGQEPEQVRYRNALGRNTPWI
jgi:hypothetical protein